MDTSVFCCLFSQSTLGDCDRLEPTLLGFLFGFVFLGLVFFFVVGGFFLKIKVTLLLSTFLFTLG